MADLRYALRTLAAHRWFAAAIVATLALGIGINTTVFTLSNAVLFKPLPFPHGDRIVVLVSTQPSHNQPRMDVSYPDLLDFRAQTSAFERIEARSGGAGVLAEADVPPDRFAMSRVTGGFFGMTGVAPVRGRTLTAEDERPDAPLAVVIGYSVWQARYQGGAVVGRAVRLNDTPANIVGVMPEGFGFPDNDRLWIALRPTGSDREARDNRGLQAYGVLKPGQSIASAARDADAVAARLAAAYPDTNREIRADVMTFNDRFNGGKPKTVFMLMLAAVGLVLLVTCANVANMLLGAALRRHREIAVRIALGASRWRIVRQLLVESLLLSAIGGLVGLALTEVGVRVFDTALASDKTGKPSWIIFTVDDRVLIYLVAICVGCSLVFGLVPALRTSRVDLNDTLKAGGRGGTGRSSWLSDALVTVQFTLAVVLLAAAGLMMRSLIAGQSVNPWLPRAQILTARVSLPKTRFPDKAARLRFLDGLSTQMTTLPGASQTAMMTVAPGQGGNYPRFELDGHLIDTPAARPSTANVVVSPGYFALVGLPLVGGRTFDAIEGTPGHEAAIVSRAFAAAEWPNQNPIGQRLRFNNDRTPNPWMTVVGVSGEIIQGRDHTASEPVVFTPLQGYDGSDMLLAVRTTAGDAAVLTRPLRTMVQQADADVVLANVQTLEDVLASQMWPYRVFGSLFLIFAATALLMAAVGLYAVMSQATTRRTREIGIRMALGASQGRVLRTVMRRGVLQVLVGLAIGLGAAFLVTGAMRSLLMGVEPGDPITFALTAIVLAGVGLAACWLPANRAASMAPVRALAHGGD